MIAVDLPDTESRTTDREYQRGIELFNRGMYFEAHEVWEELWMDCAASERRFLQALIQAAVALHHFERANHAGAARLFRSGRAYMAPYRPIHRGLNVDAFWRGMEAYLAPALTSGADFSAPSPSIVLLPEAGND